MTYVMLLTFFLHGGMIETKTIVSQSIPDCEGAKPWIMKDYLSRPFDLDGFKYDIDYLDGQCITVRKKYV